MSRVLPRLDWSKKGSVAVFALVAIASHLGGFAGSAQASLGLVMEDTPDVFSAFIYTQYTQADNRLSANGFALTLKDDEGISHQIANGAFSLNAQIDESGELGPNGTLEIGGTVLDKGFASGVLLTGYLTDFASGGPAEHFEFLFDVTGGDASELYGSGSCCGGVILQSGGFPGDFLDDFAGFPGHSDTGSVVPEPSSVIVWSLLAALGIFFPMWRRRRRRV